MLYSDYREHSARTLLQKEQAYYKNGFISPCSNTCNVPASTVHLTLHTICLRGSRPAKRVNSQLYKDPKFTLPSTRRWERKFDALVGSGGPAFHSRMARPLHQDSSLRQQTNSYLYTTQRTYMILMKITHE